MRLALPNVTLLAVDCVDFNRARAAVEFSKRDIEFGCVKLLTHFEVEDPLVQRISRISSIEDYSKFMIRELTKYFDTEFVMIVQWDGLILDATLWSNDFLMYDYIGAPWTPLTLKPGVPKQFNVGNGGFSIRSKRLHDRLAVDENLVMHEAEDVVICQLNRSYLELLGYKFAPYEIAERFSWETGIPRPTFGSHGRHKIMLSG